MISFQNIFLLSFIQGATEFLPVSSSAHLILLPNLTNNPDQGRVFDVAVHFGSLLAVVVYLWKDLFNMLIGVLSLGNKSKKEFKLFYIVLIATLPLVIFGYYIQKNNLLILRSLELIAWCTLIFGILLFMVDRFFLKVRKIDDLTLMSGLFIGLFQILAFLPGTSRSGITITASRFLGFERSSAAKISLLLSIPAILGATTLEVYDLYKLNSYDLNFKIIIASMVSFIFSIASISFMMQWISHSTFTPFVIYRTILGVVLLLAIYFW